VSKINAWVPALALLAIFISVPAFGASPQYPTKPVRFIVGHRPGGSTDIIARALQPYLQKTLGVNIVIEYVEGVFAFSIFFFPSLNTYCSLINITGAPVTSMPL
jgi:hypothetical protein